MVKLRLRRVGAKNKPMYRVVVADSRVPRNGAFIEIIGHYDPVSEEESFTIDEEKALYWLKHGAQPTDTVARLLSKSGTIAKFEPKSKAKLKPTRRKATPKTKSTSEVE